MTRSSMSLVEKKQGRFTGARRGLLCVGVIGLVMLSGAFAWAQYAEFKVENPQAGHQPYLLGLSSAMDGDTLIVGAPYSAPTDSSPVGFALVYRADGQGNWVPEAELNASETIHGLEFGRSVAISGDTAVVGIYWGGEGETISGSVLVYVRSGGVWTQQAMLTASDAYWEDYFGSSVAVSGDTVVVGAYRDDDGGTNSGSAYVFTRSGGVWTEQAKLTAIDAGADDFFGSSVAITGDTLFVGAEGDSSAYVFIRSGGGWAQQAKLTASDTWWDDSFGCSVGVSGETAVVGACRDDDGGYSSGSAYVFTRSEGVWTQEQKLTASDAAPGDLFGVSVAITGDTVVAGAPFNDDGGFDTGSAYVFTRSGGVWTERQKLTASDAVVGDSLGASVAVFGDTMVAGAPQYSSFVADRSGIRTGLAYVFARSDGQWTQQARLTDPAAEEDQFGFGVGISGDTAIVGTPCDNDGRGDSGSAYVFTRLGRMWVQQAKLIASNSHAAQLLGLSVAISGDTALVGAPGDDEHGLESGAAYVFTRSGGVWTQQAKLIASNSHAAQLLGLSVAISGDTALVGAPGDDEHGLESGAAYVFTRSGGVWTQQAKLTASDTWWDDSFGCSVAVSGETAVVGACRDDDGGYSSGSAYVFTRSEGVWTQEQKLTASDAAPGDLFGISMAITGDTVVAGAPLNDDGGFDTGSAYVFSRSGNVWTQDAKLTPQDAAASARFGRSVALCSDTLVLGAPDSDGGDPSSGSTYVFARSGGVWVQKDKLTASDAATGDGFGDSVAIFEDTIVVGARLNADPERESGSAYVFEKDATSPTATIAALPAATNQTSIPQVSVTFNKAVTGLTESDFVTTGVTVSNLQGSYATYTVDLTLTGGEGVKSIQLPAGSVADSGGNGNRESNKVNILLDTTPPISLVSVSDVTQVGGEITGTYAAGDSGSGLASVVLYVRASGGSWFSAGSVAGGTFNYTPVNGDGEYRFATVAEDAAWNRESVPAENDGGDVAVLWNDIANSPFAYASIGDGPTTFPMTADLDIIITFSGGASGGPITVSRTVGDVAPAGFDAAALIDEVLTITGSFTGSATIVWNFDPASDDTLVGPLDTVYQLEGGALLNHFRVTPDGTTLTIGPVWGFSDWYAGNADETPEGWILY